MCRGVMALAERLSTTADAATKADENDIAAIADDEDEEGKGGRRLLGDEEFDD